MIGITLRKKSNLILRSFFLLQSFISSLKTLGTCFQFTASLRNQCLSVKSQSRFNPPRFRQKVAQPEKALCVFRKPGNVRFPDFAVPTIFARGTYVTKSAIQPLVTFTTKVAHIFLIFASARISAHFLRVRDSSYE